MIDDPTDLEGVARLAWTTPRERSIPFETVLGGEPGLWGEEITKRLDVEPDIGLDGLNFCSNISCYSTGRHDMHKKLDHKVDGLDMVLALLKVMRACQDCIRLNLKWVPGLLTFVLADVFELKDAKRITKMVDYLGGEIPLRATKISVDDPFMLDELCGTYIAYFKSRRPSVTKNQSLQIILHSLQDIWPATEPSIRAAVDRAWLRS